MAGTPASRALARARALLLLLITTATRAAIRPSPQASRMLWSVVPSPEARTPMIIGRDLFFAGQPHGLVPPAFHVDRSDHQVRVPVDDHPNSPRAVAFVRFEK